MTVNFHVAIQRGIIENVYTDEQFYGSMFDDLPTNVTWTHVTVANEDAKAQWLDAMQTWQEAAYATEMARNAMQTWQEAAYAAEAARNAAEKYEEAYERARVRRDAQETMDRLQSAWNAV
jgi:hypothetical protein